MTAMLDLTTKLIGGEAGIDSKMPLLVFGGPYSNLRATEAVRKIADNLAIPAHRVICTGDVVAYCAEPEETTALIRDWGCHVIAGNCEEQLAEGAGDCGCGFEEGTACDLLAKGWYPFANARVSEASRNWMRDLPKTATFTWNSVRFRVVHGGTSVINQFIFASEKAELKRQLTAGGADVIVAGHAGVPFIAKQGDRTWFNPGVVGMPANDGTSDTWYGLITPTSDGVELSYRRLNYDFRVAAAGMRRWAYADGYAKSLITGIWPSFDVFPPTEKAQTGKRLAARTVRVARRSAAHIMAAE
jgi:predicted phosphodiesterase